MSVQTENLTQDLLKNAFPAGLHWERLQRPQTKGPLLRPSSRWKRAGKGVRELLLPLLSSLPSWKRGAADPVSSLPNWKQGPADPVSSLPSWKEGPTDPVSSLPSWKQGPADLVSSLPSWTQGLAEFFLRQKYAETPTHENRRISTAAR